MSNWHWPQYVMAGLYLYSLLHDAYRHGRPRTVTENAFVSVAAVLVGGTILHFGGFW
jgi:hypothetical protein